jgi:hypothetical protein
MRREPARSLDRKLKRAGSGYASITLSDDIHSDQDIKDAGRSEINSIEIIYKDEWFTRRSASGSCLEEAEAELILICHLIAADGDDLPLASPYQS